MKGPLHARVVSPSASVIAIDACIDPVGIGSVFSPFPVVSSAVADFTTVYRCWRWLRHPDVHSLYHPAPFAVYCERRFD